MPITKDFAFEFSWDDQDDPKKYTFSEYRFPITVPDQKAEDNLIQEVLCSFDYINFFDEMESYGVHDYACFPTTEFIGYNSYEIEPKKYDEVMTKWRDYLVSLGCECGPIVRTKHEEKSHDISE